MIRTLTMLFIVATFTMVAAPCLAADSTKSDIAIFQKPVTTKHSITIDGKKIDYDATAGHLTLVKEDGTPRAKVFYIA
ncbi:MAG: hypothetical protein ACK47W_01080 [Bacteroidota bacterium]